MADKRDRELERRATQSGSPDDQRDSLCYKIGRLSVEVPLEPTLLTKLGKGRYDGQALWSDPESGVTHPCVKWQTDNEEQFWDVVSEECVWKRPTRLVTMALFDGGFQPLLNSFGANPSQMAIIGTPSPGEPGLMDALRDLGSEQYQNPAGEFGFNEFVESLGNLPVVESPHIPPDQILLVQPQPLSPFLREYPARFEDHAADAMRYAAEAAREKQGDEDEAEG